MEKLVLIDGNSIMHRAFYGIMVSKALTTKDGTYTNAVYGFLAILFKIIDDIHTFRAITNSSIKIDRRDNQQVSVFAYGDKAIGVTEDGFHYPLQNYTLSPFDGALGTSNDIINDFGVITVENGTLIIIETIV